MSKFVNPFSDYGFKLIFGTELSKDIIIQFLNALLRTETIVDITFRNVEALGLAHDQRRAVFDIFCETEKGECIIVEMQKSRQKYFSDRVLYYASFAIQQQAIIIKEKLEKLAKLERPEELPDEIKKRWNYNIDRVYVVCILNYVMDKSHPEKYRWDVVRMDRDLKVPFSETLNEIYLEMPKFRLSLSECDTLDKKLLYVLNNIEIMERLPKELNEQIFEKLKSLVEIERMTPDERLAYELSLSVERDLSGALEASYEDGEEKGMEKGIEKGIEKGKIEGLAEGMAQGMEKGKIEGKMEGIMEGVCKTARNFKSLGISLADIVKATGLPLETVQSL